MGQFSMWAGSFALAVIMIPVVVRSTEVSLKLVPTSLRWASLALGASQRQTVRLITLPGGAACHHYGGFLGDQPHRRRDGAAIVDGSGQ